MSILKDFIVISNEIKRSLDALAKDVGCSGSQCRLIDFIKRNEKKGLPVYQKDLEKEFNLSKSTICELIQSMENNNLIEKLDNTLDHDSRYKELILTEEGEKIYGITRNNEKKIEDNLLVVISKDEKDHLKIVLEKLKKSLLERDISLYEKK